jgi:flagellar hook-length control protein FliK
MNITPTTNLPPAGAAASGESVVVGAVPAAVFDTLAAATPLTAPLADAAAPFAQWLAQALPELLAEAALPEVDASDAEPTEASADGVADSVTDGVPAQPVAQDVTMLAAMAAPLVAPAALPASAPAAGAAPAFAGASDEQDAGGDVFLAAISRGAGASRGPAGAAARMEARAAAAQDTQGAADGAARVAMPATSNETAAPAAAATAASTPARPAAGVAGAQAGAAAADGAGPDKLASVAAPAWGATAPATSTAASPVGATVALEGPPAAWRQTLQSALGERLQTQVGSNMEQAVIRLEPPNLGRIEIAIRHSAGALEVSLSATHTEVVRQLHAVTENLRSDLASRQYSDVSVTVAQAAPRAQQGASNPFADQQGRGRQPSREQDDATPGTALQDAGNPNTSFSLNGRD